MTFEELLPTNYVADATRAVLTQRLAEAEAAPSYQPQLLAPETYRLLEAVVARLFPQPERAQPIPLAYAIDKRLAAGTSDGWRYDALPPDREAYRLGLGGIEQIARALFKSDFEQLAPEQQDEVLRSLAGGNPPGEVWQEMPADRFFEEMLAELAEHYYAHPWAQNEIGYTGYADLPRWEHIGLNEKDPREQRSEAAAAKEA